MKTFPFFKIISSSLFLIFISIAVSAQSADPSEVRVRVSVVSGDESLEVRAISFLERELKKEENVLVVFDDPDWEIKIIASRSLPRGGVRKDFAFSVLFLKPLDGYSSYKVVDHQLMVGYPNLQSACERIIDNFRKNMSK